MFGYLNSIRISDGQHSVWREGVSEITIRHKDGTTKVLTGDFKTGREKNRNPNYHCSTFLLGHETKSKTGALIERLQYGKEYRNADVTIPYSARTWQSVHGTIKRRAELWRAPCTIHTEFKRGRFIKQRTFWSNGIMAYEFNRPDTEVKAQYLNGKPAIEIKHIEVDYKGNWNTKEMLRAGVSIFEKQERGSIFGYNYAFTQYDRLGKAKNKGAYRASQRTGKWLINYKRQAFWQGIMVDEDLINTKAESIPTSRVLKETNAQVRAMLIGKIGLTRLCTELKARQIHTEIDRAGNPMRLLELPVRADDGNGQENGSRIRVLDVICPTTKNHYFLGVPDKVWQRGDRLELNTCTLAKQYGFQRNDSEITEEIEFIKET